MKNNAYLVPLSVFCLACGGADSGQQENASREVNLARQVSGTFLLSTDVEYDEACNYLGEEYVRGTFELGADTELTVHDSQKGCEFTWGGGKEVVVSLHGMRPFPSIYEAQYTFDELYQPAVFAKGHRSSRPAITGDYTQDNVAEGPTAGMAGYKSVGMGVDSSAANDSSQTYARVQSTAVRLTPPAKATATGRAVAGIGDKAIWDSNKHTLHVLYLHHLIDVTVHAEATPGADLVKAEQLAAVFLDRLTKLGKGGISTPPDQEEGSDEGTN